MNISMLQMDIKPSDRTANMDTARRLMVEAARTGPDVIALPEIWDIGFYPGCAPGQGDEDGALARKFLSRAAREHQVNIVGGSVGRSAENALWNSCYVFDRQGREIARYDKTHLFSPSHEDKIFRPGDGLVTFSLDGVPAAAIICYDLRFGELARMAALAGAKVLFVPAAWPEPRLHVWRLLLRARAMENQFFVVGINGCGRAGKLCFGGHSLVADPLGEVLAEAGGEEGVVRAGCDFSVLDEVRGAITVFRDRRPEIYRIGRLAE